MASNPISQENIYFLILAGLLDSEDHLLFSRSSEQERIDTWLTKFNQTKHIPSCQRECTRCQCVSDFILTQETLDEMKKYLPEQSNDNLIRLVLEIYLVTQPEQRFASRKEFMDYFNHGDGDRKYIEIFDLLDSSLQRKEAWEQADVTKKEQTKVMINLLYNHIKTTYLLS